MWCQSLSLVFRSDCGLYVGLYDFVCVYVSVCASMLYANSQLEIQSVELQLFAFDVRLIRRYLL